MKMKNQENPVGIIQHLIFIIVKMVEIVLEVNLHLHINIIHGIEIEKLVVLHLALRERKKNCGKKSNKGIVIFNNLKNFFFIYLYISYFILYYI